MSYLSAGTLAAICALALTVSHAFQPFGKSRIGEASLSLRARPSEHVSDRTPPAEEVNRAILLKELFSEVQENGEDMNDIIAKETVALYADPLLLSSEGDFVEEPPEGVEGDLTTIQYLQHQLKIPEDILANMLLKYSWILYLKVDSNLKPTVEVFKEFGFKDTHIRQMVSTVPSILAINHQFTLPEKLISLQTMFSLTKGGLVKLCTGQPLLLTCSIERNMDVASFLEESMCFTSAQISNLIVGYPKLIMTGVSAMKASYKVLNEIYRLDEDEVRYVCQRCPTLLTKATLKNGAERLAFLSEELGLPITSMDKDMALHHQSPPRPQQTIDVCGLKKAILRFPALLHIDVDVFLRPNVRILREYLHLDDQGLIKLVGVFPQLLGHNPITLENHCRGALLLLTGLPRYLPNEESTTMVMRDSSITEMVSESELGQGLFDTLTSGMVVPSKEAVGEGVGVEGAKRGRSSKDKRDKEVAKSKRQEMQGREAQEAREAAFFGFEGMDLVEDIVEAAEKAVTEHRYHFLRISRRLDELEREALRAAQMAREQGSCSEKERQRVVSGASARQSRAKVDLQRFKKRSLRKRLLERRKQGHMHNLMLAADLAKEQGDGVSRGSDWAKENSSMLGSIALSEEHVGVLEQVERDGLLFERTVEGAEESEEHRGDRSTSNYLSNTQTNAAKLMLSACGTLKLDEGRALSVAATSPWILAYRAERSACVLGALSISLGMSCSEISKCVGVYPRLLSLSVEGKLADVLRALAQSAADMYVQSTRVSLELELEERVAKLRHSASLSTSDNRRRPVPRKCLSAPSLGASALGDVDMALEVSKKALDGAIELREEEEEAQETIPTVDFGIGENAHAGDRGSGQAEADSEGWQDIDLFAELPPPAHDSTREQEQEQEEGQGQDSMVRIYEELCENQGVPLDPLVASAIEDVHARRRSTVRSMLRSLVLRYPLILGTSLARIEGRLQELKEGEDRPPLDELGWPDVVNFIRRAEPAHKRWLAKATAAARSPVKKRKKKDAKRVNTSK